ncbi:hypothetical protein CDAR_592461 [Caerostris darwini]|uniref:Uncharacterized protein n=1 Tax=Caerostris darwini TaxID=1538125 RepID=A0AAV4V7K0_9ARAC|nr:hypothetical protein CDAR_592461 [Caerostris darwini]
MARSFRKQERGLQNWLKRSKYLHKTYLCLFRSQTHQLLRHFFKDILSPHQKTKIVAILLLFSSSLPLPLPLLGDTVIIKGGIPKEGDRYPLPWLRDCGRSSASSRTEKEKEELTRFYGVSSLLQHSCHLFQLVRTESPLPCQMRRDTSRFLASEMRIGMENLEEESGQTQFRNLV